MGKIIVFFANTLGYLLNALYNFFGNYGIAIILFTIILKVLILPISIGQQKTMKKSAKIQDELKKIQEKYKNDPVRQNQETMDLYKRENMSPFSGCLSSIVQLLIVLSMFYLVSSPLTYMKKIDANVIADYKTKIVEENPDTRYLEIAIIKNYSKDDDRLYLNMNFLGLDLSDVPSQNYTDPKVYIIPGLYVIMSFVSMRLMNKLNKKNKDNNSTEKIEPEEIVEDNETTDLIEQPEEDKESDMMEEMTKNMNIMMPMMSVMIAMIAPLGLALYWLVSNIFSICERLILNKMFNDDKEEQNG